MNEGLQSRETELKQMNMLSWRVGRIKDKMAKREIHKILSERPRLRCPICVLQ